jgi:hypothetical protein
VTKKPNARKGAVRNEVIKGYDSVGPQPFLLVRLTLTVGWIGLLGYGFLALIRY